MPGSRFAMFLSLVVFFWFPLPCYYGAEADGSLDEEHPITTLVHRHALASVRPRCEEFLKLRFAEGQNLAGMLLWPIWNW